MARASEIPICINCRENHKHCGAAQALRNIASRPRSRRLAVGDPARPVPREEPAHGDRRGRHRHGGDPSRQYPGSRSRAATGWGCAAPFKRTPTGRAPAPGGPERGKRTGTEHSHGDQGPGRSAQAPAAPAAGGRMNGRAVTALTRPLPSERTRGPARAPRTRRGLPWRPPPLGGAGVVTSAAAAITRCGARSGSAAAAGVPRAALSPRPPALTRRGRRRCGERGSQGPAGRCGGSSSSR